MTLKSSDVILSEKSYKIGDKAMTKKSKKLKRLTKLAMQITESDGKVRTIGHYFPEQRVFRCTRNKSEHYMRKLEAWGLDANTVKYLIKENATVELKDTETKWTFSCKASDFLVYGTIEEHKTHRPQYFLNIKKWEVVRATNKSSVLKCHAVCKHNMFGNCIRGTIEITKDGECLNLE